jgi:hypothetical protein
LTPDVQFDVPSATLKNIQAYEKKSQMTLKIEAESTTETSLTNTYGIISQGI